MSESTHAPYGVTAAGLAGNRDSGEIEGNITHVRCTPTSGVCTAGSAVYVDQLTYVVQNKGTLVHRRRCGKRSQAGAQGTHTACGSAGPTSVTDDSDGARTHNDESSTVAVPHPEPGDYKAILQGVSCVLPAGQLSAIMGPSGGGKTSLRMVLCAHVHVVVAV